MGRPARCSRPTVESRFLHAVNKAKDTVYDFVLVVVLREWEGRYTYQINVNAAVAVAPQ